MVRTALLVSRESETHDWMHVRSSAAVIGPKQKAFLLGSRKKGLVMANKALFGNPAAIAQRL
jgi:hypothetical protein